MSQPVSQLDEPMARVLVLQLVASGGTVTQAAEAIDCHRRAIQRYAVRVPEFGAALEEAKRIGALAGDQTEIVGELLLSWQAQCRDESPEVGLAKLKRDRRAMDVLGPIVEPERRPPLPPPPPMVEVPIVPAPGEPASGRTVHDAEVVGAKSKAHERVAAELPPLNETNLLAFYWRTAHDTSEHPSVRRETIRCMNDHVLMRSRHQRMMQVQEAMARGESNAPERGLTRARLTMVRNLIIGPDPGERKAVGPSPTLRVASSDEPTES